MALAPARSARWRKSRLTIPGAHVIRRDEGFTLVEMLVVVLVLGVLASIALPQLLRYREKAWVAQLQSGLRNGASAQVVVMSSRGAYTEDVAMLRDDGGWRAAPDVSLTTGTSIGETTYCLEGTHAQLRPDHQWKVAHYSSVRGTFEQGACPDNLGDGNGATAGDDTGDQDAGDGDGHEDGEDGDGEDGDG